MTPVVELAGVNFRRGATSILRDVNLRIAAGEHWVILGPNGAGKSTVLSICGANAYPTTGTATILGQTLGRTNVAELRRRIGHVNARYPLVSALTVRQVVLTGITSTVELPMWWQPNESELNRVAEAIEQVGLTERQRARWPTLSQGERGRALIARALIEQPKLLLLDEPCADLDMAAREQFLQTMVELAGNQRGLASVLVTHHAEEIPSSTTHAVLLAHGRVRAIGVIADVLTSENLSATFATELLVSRLRDRWTVIADHQDVPLRSSMESAN